MITWQAEFYNWAAFGKGLNATLLGGGPGSVGGEKAQLSYAVQQYATEIANDELNHVSTTPCCLCYWSYTLCQAWDSSAERPPVIHFAWLAAEVIPLQHSVGECICVVIYQLTLLVCPCRWRSYAQPWVLRPSPAPNSTSAPPSPPSSMPPWAPRPPATSSHPTPTTLTSCSVRPPTLVLLPSHHFVPCLAHAACLQCRPMVTGIEILHANSLQCSGLQAFDW